MDKSLRYKPIIWIGCTVGFLLFIVFQYYNFQTLMLNELADHKSYETINRVKDFLNYNQILINPYDNYPYGSFINQSAPYPIFVGIFAIILMGFGFTENSAILYGAAGAQAFLFIAFIYFTLWAVIHQSTTRAGLIGIFLLLFSYNVYQVSQVNIFSHYLLSLTCLGLAHGLMLRGQDGYKNYDILAGIVIALALWINTDNIIMICALLFIRSTVRIQNGGPKCIPIAVGFILSVLILKTIELNSGWSSERLGWIHVLFAVIISIPLVATDALAGRKIVQGTGVLLLMWLFAFIFWDGATQFLSQKPLEIFGFMEKEEIIPSLYFQLLIVTPGLIGLFSSFLSALYHKSLQMLGYSFVLSIIIPITFFYPSFAIYSSVLGIWALIQAFGNSSLFTQSQEFDSKMMTIIVGFFILYQGVITYNLYERQKIESCIIDIDTAKKLNSIDSTSFFINPKFVDNFIWMTHHKTNTSPRVNHPKNISNVESKLWVEDLISNRKTQFVLTCNEENKINIDNTKEINMDLKGWKLFMVE